MNDLGPEAAGPADFQAKFFWLGVLVLAAGLLYWQFGQFLSLEYFAEQESRIKALQRRSPLLLFAAAFLIYVVATGLSLPGATLLTLLMSWFLGFWPALILISFASTTGATVAFLLSRYFFRDSIERRFGQRLRTFDQALEKEGAFYLFTLRLIPAIPFFVINAVAGLTRIKTLTFWWVSQLGMLPGTAVYAWAGSRVPDLETLSSEGIQAVFSSGQLIQFTIAFVLLGLFPLAARWIVRRYRTKSPEDSEERN